MNIQTSINRIEASAKDELQLLSEIGATYYSTTDLIRLKGNWEMRRSFFDKCQTSVILLGTCSPLWIAFSFAFSAAGLNYVASITFFLFPVTFLLFFGGLFLMWYFFKGKGHLESIGEQIDQELSLRNDKIDLIL